MISVKQLGVYLMANREKRKVLQGPPGPAGPAGQPVDEVYIKALINREIRNTEFVITAEDIYNHTFTIKAKK